LAGNTGTNPANQFVGTVDAQDLAFRTANIERLRILGTGANAGFVGINTVAPTARLDVDGSLRTRGAATFNDTVTVTNLLTANGGVATPSVTNAGTLALNATGASGTLTASTNGSERLRITSAGDVGIGTTAPTTRLDVNGTFRARSNAQLDGTLTVTGATTINNTLLVSNAATFSNAVTIAGLLRANGGTQTTTLSTSGNATVGGNLGVTGTTTLTGLLTANAGVNTTTLAASTSVTTPLVTNAGTLALSGTGASGTITFGTTGTAGTAGTERLRITSTGRVGINTGATVDAALQVNTGADATVGLIVRGNSATQSADLLRLVRGGGGSVLTANANGSLTLLPFGSATGNTNELRFAGLSGANYVGFKAPDAIGANLIWTLPDSDGGSGNVLATNGGGRLQWINPLTASSGWTLLGNSATTSGGVLGATPTFGTNFLGTIDESTPVDLRFVTGNRVRAIITGAGQFQTNNVAIGGGAINDTAIGNLSPSTGVFTFLTANNRVTTPLVTGSALQLASSAGNLTLQATGGDIRASTSGQERFRITTGGNVGINQANPGAMLDVNGTFNAALAATFGNTVTVAGTATAAKFIPTGGTAAGNGMFLPEANTLAFSTANTERLRIDADGRIGIGMVPVRTLDVTGSFGTTGNATIDGALTVGGATTLNNTLTVAGASNINNTLGVTGRLTASGGIDTTDLVATGAGSFGGTLGVTGATTLGDTLTVAGASTLNNTLRVTGATTLDSALTVGGATQVNNTLGVTGLLTAGGGISTTNLAASGNGSVGGNLGVTGSATVTSLGGAARTDLTGLDRVVMSDPTGLLSQVSTATLVGATAWALTGNTGTNPTNNFLGTRDAADLAIRTANADRIRILGTGANAGFVGINTTAPTAMLDVNGGLRVRGDSALNGALNVGGATALSGDLSVGGISILTGLLVANGGINTTSVTASSNGSFGGTLNVTGASTLGTLSAGNTTVTGTLGVNGATTLNNGLTVAAGATSVGALSASGTVTLGAGTPNGVAFLDGTRVLTTGSALTFDGTNLATTGSATATKFVPTGGTAAGNGMYLPAANEVAFSTNDVERLRLTSSGNVGIGLSTPTNLLDVGGTFRASGAANFSSSLTVAVGNFTSLGGTLGVTGITTLTNLGGTAATTIPVGLDRIVRHHARHRADGQFPRRDQQPEPAAGHQQPGPRGRHRGRCVPDQQRRDRRRRHQRHHDRRDDSEHRPLHDPRCDRQRDGGGHARRHRCDDAREHARRGGCDDAVLHARRDGRHDLGRRDAGQQHADRDRRDHAQQQPRCRRQRQHHRHARRDGRDDAVLHARRQRCDNLGQHPRCLGRHHAEQPRRHGGDDDPGRARSHRDGQQHGRAVAGVDLGAGHGERVEPERQPDHVVRHHARHRADGQFPRRDQQPEPAAGHQQPGPRDRHRGRCVPDQQRRDRRRRHQRHHDRRDDSEHRPLHDPRCDRQRDGGGHARRDGSDHGLGWRAHPLGERHDRARLDGRCGHAVADGGRRQRHHRDHQRRRAPAHRRERQCGRRHQQPDEPP
jgi:hypothetical protein